MIIFGKEKPKNLILISFELWQNESVTNQQITVEVFNQVWRWASVLAEQNRRNLEDVLEKQLEETVSVNSFFISLVQ